MFMKCNEKLINSDDMKWNRCLSPTNCWLFISASSIAVPLPLLYDHQFLWLRLCLVNVLLPSCRRWAIFSGRFFTFTACTALTVRDINCREYYNSLSMHFLVHVDTKRAEGWFFARALHTALAVSLCIHRNIIARFCAVSARDALNHCIYATRPLQHSGLCLSDISLACHECCTKLPCSSQWLLRMTLNNPLIGQSISASPSPKRAKYTKLAAPL